MSTRMRAVASLLLVTLAAAAVASAQGVITSGNTSYQIQSLPSSAVSGGTVTGRFTANPGTVVNALPQHGWFYRLDPLQREFGFNAGSGQLTQNYVGNTATLQWADVDFQSRLRATWTVTVQSTGPTAGIAQSQMSITNISPAPLTVSLFAYADVNLCVPNNTALPNPTTARHLLRSALCPTERVEFAATGHDHYEVQPPGVLLGRLNDPLPDLLGDVGLPFVGDYTGCFQWRDRVLLPLQTLTATVTFQHNPPQTVVGSVSDANASYTVLTVPNSPASPAGQITFSANPSVPLVASQHWWYYRLNNDSRESAFNDAGGQLTQSYVGNTATLAWSNVDGRNVRARWTVTVQSTGPGAGFAWSRMAITNDTGLPLTLNLFAHGNLDLCQSPGNEVAAPNPGFDRHRVQSVLPCGSADFAEFAGTAADAYEVQPGATLLNRLVDASVDTLASVGLPFGPGDYAGAFQWRNRVLQPGATFTAEIAIAHNLSFTGPGRIRRVAPSGAPYQEIGPAIADCAPGDVVLVAAGTYQPFVLDRGVTVLGRVGANPVVVGQSRVTGIPAGQTAALGGLVFRSREWLQTATDEYALRIEPGAGTVVVRACTAETGTVTWRGIAAPIAALAVSGCTTLLDGVTCQGRSGTSALVVQAGSWPVLINGGSYVGGDSDCGLFCFPDTNPAGAGILVSGGTAYLSEVNARGGSVANFTRTSVGGTGLVAVGGTTMLRSCTLAGGMGSPHAGDRGGDGLFMGGGATLHVDSTSFVPGPAGSPQGQPGQPTAGVGTLLARFLAGLSFQSPFLDLGTASLMTVRGRPGEPFLLFLALNNTPLPGAPFGLPEPLFLAPPQLSLTTLVLDGTGQASLALAVPNNVTLFGIPLIFQPLGFHPTQNIIVGMPAGSLTHSAAVQ